jgi:hypothetical protein
MTLTVIIDDREHALYEKCNTLNTGTMKISKSVLHLGDIHITRENEQQPLLIIERKSISDLLASIKDGRYEEQSHRLVHASQMHRHNIIYIIEGTMGQISRPTDKKLLYSSITSLLYFKGFSVLRTSSVLETAELILHMTEKMERNFLKKTLPWFMTVSQIPTPTPTPTSTSQKSIDPLQSPIQDQEKMEISDTMVFTAVDNSCVEKHTVENIVMELSSAIVPSYSSFVRKEKSANITIHNICEIMLCQIPRINTVAAVAIATKFSSIHQLTTELKNTPDCLDDIKTLCNGKYRKLGKDVIENVKLFLA